MCSEEKPSFSNEPLERGFIPCGRKFFAKRSSASVIILLGPPATGEVYSHFTKVPHIATLHTSAENML